MERENSVAIEPKSEIGKQKCGRGCDVRRGGKRERNFCRGFPFSKIKIK